MKKCWIPPSNTTHFFEVHPEGPVGAQGWTVSKSCIYKNFLHFWFSRGPFYDKSPNSAFLVISILGYPRTLGAPGLTVSKRGKYKKFLEFDLSRGVFYKENANSKIFDPDFGVPTSNPGLFGPPDLNQNSAPYRFWLSCSSFQKGTSCLDNLKIQGGDRFGVKGHFPG